MDKIILTAWITITIFTIIPNIITIYKFYTKKYTDFIDMGFLSYLCLFLFIVFSVIVTGNFIYIHIN